MRKSKNVSSFVLLYCLGAGWLLPQSGWAGQYGTSVTNAQIVVRNDVYVLNADVDFILSPIAVQALQSGIPLTWELNIEIQRPRQWLWHQAIVEKKIGYRISYQALLNMYQIDNPEGENFTTLSRALKKLGTIRNVPLLKREKKAEESDYLAAVKVSFDRESLPLPLRPESYFNAGWFLSGEWYRWPVRLAVRSK